VSRIVTAGTAGGLLGGLLAERAGVWGSVEAMLPMLAAIHAACAAALLRWSSSGPARAAARGGDAIAGIPIIARSPYLQSIVALVLVTTIGETLLDFVFKARAAAAAGGGDQLLRLFAVFYTSVAAVSIGVQTVGTRLAFRRLGLARTAALLPASVAAGGAAALAFPGLSGALGARSAESITRISLYRPAYELLFTPLASRDRRAAKTIVDVGGVRLGDLAGGALVQFSLLVAGAYAAPSLLALAVLVSLVGLRVAFRIQRGYVNTLEKSLLDRAGELDLSEVDDAAVRTTLLQSVGAPVLSMVTGMSLPALPDVAGPSGPMAPPEPPRPTSAPLDPQVLRAQELRSHDPERVRRALADGPVTPGVAADAIRLLAWDTVARDAIQALRLAADRLVGQLVDRMLDPEEEFAIRRRIPLVLAAARAERAVHGLVAALDDPRFEVRYRAGRALSKIARERPDLRLDREHMVAMAAREVAVDRGVWESRRLLDQSGDDEEWSPVLDELLRDRANRSLEHVFTILALVLPREPLQVAFRGLHTTDPMLRGTALEYLETALPSAVRQPLWPFLEDDRTRRRDARPSNEVVADLLKSRLSIQVNLERKGEGT
ncbi:MAG TPA: hypothetical protein VD793_06050, partial [Gemmatimonadales bacterium]|nr:hypothetical protein [Gemmatimonadales bacterium]